MAGGRISSSPHDSARFASLGLAWTAQSLSLLLPASAPGAETRGQDPRAVRLRCRDKNTAGDATVSLHICRRSGGKEQVPTTKVLQSSCVRSCVPSSRLRQAVAIAHAWPCAILPAPGGMTDLPISIAARDLGSCSFAETFHRHHQICERRDTRVAGNTRIHVISSRVLLRHVKEPTPAHPHDDGLAASDPPKSSSDDGEHRDWATDTETKAWPEKKVPWTQPPSLATPTTLNGIFPLLVATTHLVRARATS